jgi:hypothetical protein
MKVLIFLYTLTCISQFPYRCPACDLTFISESAAMVQHKQCSAWSCAFPNSLKEAVWPKSLLRPHDFGHDAQQTGSKPADQQIDCVLCGLTFEGIWDDIEEQMHLHLNFHGLPCHDKTVYSFSEFTDHMRGHHRLDMFSKSFNMHTLDPWNREIRSSYSYSSVHNWGS